MSLVEFTKNAAGPPQGTDKVAFGPYFAGDVVDFTAGSITKLADATKTAKPTATANKHTSTY